MNPKDTDKVIELELRVFSLESIIRDMAKALRGHQEILEAYAGLLGIQEKRQKK